MTPLKRITSLSTGTFLIVVVVAATSFGCDDALVKPPLGELTSENFFTRPEHAEQATNATYSQLRNWAVHVFAWIGMTDIVADDATKGSTPADAPFLLELDNLTFDDGNTAFQGTWNGYYQGVYRANVALQNIPNIDMDSALQERLLAENRFLRAYYYFFLVRAYGGVPLITEPLRPDEFQQPRATADAIYSLIIDDLEAAIGVLPEKSQYGANDIGRATKGAARGLLASVYLHRGDFTNAERLAREVIESNEYQLFGDFSQLFTRAGENASESVFEVQATAREEGGVGSQYSQVQMVRGTPNIGWGFNQPSDDLETAFEPGDLRHGATILYPWELLPDGSGQVVFANPNIDNQRYNQKAFISPNVPGGSGNAGTNIRRVRFADVLLMAAESAYRNGNEAEARRFLNDVRERAREGHESTVGVITETIADMLLDHLGLSADDRGVMIRRAQAGGPASQNGLASASFGIVPGESVPLVERLDIIQRVNGTSVETPEEFLSIVGAVSPGTTVELDVLTVTQTRDGGEFTTSTESRTLSLATIQRLPEVTSGGQDLLEAIWHERRVELALEQHRWFDLIRQGRAAAVMQALGKPFQTGKHELYPIPQGEIDLSGGLIEQNPGY